MTEIQDNPIRRKWVHAPSHIFLPKAIYIVTAGTYRKARLFDTPAKRDFLLHALLAETEHWGWRLEAWAVMPNHYHFVAQAPEMGESLRRMITALHSKTAIWLNKADGISGRKVWFQYWDTCLTYEGSYLARLRYVHHNPVKHGLTQKAEDYPWCSMAWFARKAAPDFQERVFSFPCDNITIADDF